MKWGQVSKWDIPTILEREKGTGTFFDERPEHGDQGDRKRCQSPFSLPSLSGRLIEISASSAGAPLALAFRLVLDAQRRGEPAAWVARCDSTFYPPDVADAGVDLGALPVVRAPEPIAAARAADLLVRSGAFGLVVLDLGGRSSLPMPAFTRLGGLAHRHGAAVVFLTEKDPLRPSLGPLVAVRAHAARISREQDRFFCEARVLKDKRGRPGWRHAEVFHGPDGLR